MSTVIDKFGVPIPGVARHTMKMPKLKHKFRVLFFGFGATGDGDMISLETNTCGAPTETNDKGKVHSYNSQSNYKGKPSWNTIEINFRDTIDNLSLKAFNNQLRREFNHYTQESRLSASQYKFEMWIQSLDGSNSDNVTNLFEGTLSTWVCQGCFIDETNAGDWDYSSSEYQSLALTIQPDVCFLLGPNGDALGDSVEGSGKPENANAITSSPTKIDSGTLPDSNFYPR